MSGMKKERTNPKEIEGKQALFVVNLEPREMFGIVSEGMLFDIGYDNGIVPVLATPEKPGARRVLCGIGIATICLSSSSYAFVKCFKCCVCLTNPYNCSLTNKR